MKIMKFSIAGILAASALGLGVPALANNIVANGNFDANSPPDGTAPLDWTLTHAAYGSDFFVGAGPVYGAFSPPNSANFGATGDLDDELSQVLATVAGDSYTISFELAHAESDSLNDFSAWFGTNEIFSIVNQPAFDYTLESFTAVATSSSTTLAFFGREVPSWYDLDNVDVSGTTTVPEPASLGLFGLALAGVALSRRRFAR